MTEEANRQPSNKANEKQKKANRQYYLSHAQQWHLYAKARRKRIHDHVKKQCGGMKI